MSEKFEDFAKKVTYLHDTVFLEVKSEIIAIKLKDNQMEIFNTVKNCIKEMMIFAKEKDSENVAQYGVSLEFTTIKLKAPLDAQILKKFMLNTMKIIFESEDDLDIFDSKNSLEYRKTQGKLMFNKIYMKCSLESTLAKKDKSKTISKI